MTGFIADIHGNLAALKAVLAALDQMGCADIYSLGDVVGYYNKPVECARLLQQRKILHLRGNHEEYLLTGLQARSTTVNRLIDAQRAVIDSATREWLTQCPFRFDTPAFCAVHGGPEDYLFEYCNDFCFPDGIDATLFLTGHTHKQALWQRGARTHGNPGSVGQPRDGDPRAAFAVLDDRGALHLHRTAYDIDATADAMRKAGFEERLYENLYQGTAIQTHP